MEYPLQVGMSTAGWALAGAFQSPLNIVVERNAPYKQAVTIQQVVVLHTESHQKCFFYSLSDIVTAK